MKLLTADRVHWKIPLIKSLVSHFISSVITPSSSWVPTPGAQNFGLRSDRAVGVLLEPVDTIAARINEILLKLGNLYIF